MAKYAELIGAILDAPTIASFCYTQLTDIEQETNGLRPRPFGARRDARGGVRRNGGDDV